jgi:hypothetical protein
MTSELIYTPTQDSACDNYVVQASIWSLDSNGTRYKSGVFRKEQFHFIDQWNNNNPPKINGPNSYSVCSDNELCFNISASDQTFIPPPPAPSPAPDTVTLSWDGAMANLGATLSVNDTVRLQTARFCWTPTARDVSSMPYRFTIIAQDNNGPLNGISKRIFSIYVKQTASGSNQYSDVKCGSDVRGLRAEVIVDSGISGTPYYRMELLDTGHHYVFNTSKIRFNSTQTFLSTQAVDTLLGDTTGVFVIKTTINNMPYNCLMVYYDTVSIGFTSPVVTDILKDSVYCDIISDTLRIPGSWDSIRWSTGDSLNYLYIDTVGMYEVELVDSCGNKYKFSSKIELKYSPNISFQDLYYICPSDSLTFNYSHPNNFDITWSNGDTINEVTLKDSGLYTVRVSNYCSTENDTFEIIHNELPKGEILVDSSVCEELRYSFRYIKGSENNFIWEQNDVVKNDSSLVSYTQETIALITYNKCGKDTSTLYLNPLMQPSITILDDTLQGCLGDSFKIEASGNHSNNWLWSTGDTAQNITVKESSTYWIVCSNHCGSSKDSIWVAFDSIPVAKLIDDTTICVGDTLILEPLLKQAGSTIWWKNALPDSVLKVFDAGEYVLIQFNSCGNTTDTVMVDQLDIPHVNLGLDTVVNIPFSLSLDGGEADIYMWNKGQTSKSITVSDTGRYWVVTSNLCGTNSDTILLSDTSRIVDAINLPNNNLNVYPNPSSDYVIVEMNEHMDEILLFNNLGNKVSGYVVSANKVILKLKEYNPGIYYLNIKSGEVSIWTQIIVER